MLYLKTKTTTQKNNFVLANSLVVWWLGLCAFSGGVMGLIPDPRSCKPLHSAMTHTKMFFLFLFSSDHKTGSWSTSNFISLWSLLGKSCLDLWLQLSTIVI